VVVAIIPKIKITIIIIITLISSIITETPLEDQKKVSLKPKVPHILSPSKNNNLFKKNPASNNSIINIHLIEKEHLHHLYTLTPPEMAILKTIKNLQ
jgi:hypothetical protein